MVSDHQGVDVRETDA
jgi:hypothetical protein